MLPRDGHYDSKGSKKYHGCQVTWGPNPEKTHLIGTMTLKKNKVVDHQGSVSMLLGLKVVGGQLLPNNRRGALIEKVKKGSIADAAGKLRPGDEVLEWNGQDLQSKSYEEVHTIISNSRQDEHVRLIVSRPILVDPYSLGYNESSMQQISPGSRSDPLYGASDKPLLTISDPLGHQASLAPGQDPRVGRSNATSRIQIKTVYKPEKCELLVSIISAMNLPTRRGMPPGGEHRNPYAKVFLLPDRSEMSKRRTKTIHNCNNPLWNQTFLYGNIQWAELQLRLLEVTVWDFDRFGTNDFLGETTVNLASSLNSLEAEWYCLNVQKATSSVGGGSSTRLSLPTAGDGLIGGLEPDPMQYTDHLSPPSTIGSRFSDSEISDLEDMSGGGGYRRSRRLPMAAPSDFGSIAGKFNDFFILMVPFYFAFF